MCIRSITLRTDSLIVGLYSARVYAYFEATVRNTYDLLFNSNHNDNECDLIHGNSGVTPVKRSTLEKCSKVCFFLKKKLNNFTEAAPFIKIVNQEAQLRILTPRWRPCSYF